MDKDRIKNAIDIANRLQVALVIYLVHGDRDAIADARRHVLELFKGLAPSALAEEPAWVCGRCRKEVPGHLNSCEACHVELGAQAR